MPSIHELSDHMDIELRDGFPLPCPDFFEEAAPASASEALFCNWRQSPASACAALLPAVDFHLLNQLRIMISHRNSQPLPSVGRLDPVSVLPFILLELDRVQQNKDIGPVESFRSNPARVNIGADEWRESSSTWDGS